MKYHDPADEITFEVIRERALNDLKAENARLREALFMLTDHACETHPHFESPRGQVDIARAVVALGDDAKRLAYQHKVRAALAVERSA